MHSQVYKISGTPALLDKIKLYRGGFPDIVGAGETSVGQEEQQQQQSGSGGEEARSGSNSAEMHLSDVKI